MELSLGCAQLGMDYGVANTSGKPSFSQAEAIVKTAFEHGIRHFDTAQLYGDSERTLGEISHSFSEKEQSELKFTTKIKLQKEVTLWDTMKMSLKNLRTGKIFAVLLHNENDYHLLRKEDWETLNQLNRDGVIEFFGLSHYDPEIFEEAAADDRLGCFQIPANIWDRRFFSTAKRILPHKQIALRSIFLQGLALMHPELMPTHHKLALDAVHALHNFCNTEAITPIEFCLGYISSHFGHTQARAVIGVDSPEQIKEIVKVFNQLKPLSDQCEHWEQLRPQWPKELVDPRLWPEK